MSDDCTLIKDYLPKQTDQQVTIEDIISSRAPRPKVLANWKALIENRLTVLAGNVFVAHTESEYNQIIVLLNSLIDEVGEDESHPLASLMQVLSVLIENYEAEHVPELTVE